MRQPFPSTALPHFLQEFVGEVAESLGCDESFVALPAFSALASVIGNTRQIQLRAGWTESPVVWTGLVADPGEGKTPAIRAATRSLFDLAAGCRIRRWRACPRASIRDGAVGNERSTT